MEGAENIAFRPGGDMQGGKMLWHVTGDARINGFVTFDEMMMKVRNLYISKRVSHKDQPGRSQRSWFKKDKVQHFTTDNMQPGGEVFARIMCVFADYVHNHGGNLGGGDFWRVMAKNMLNDVVLMRGLKTFGTSTLTPWQKKQCFAQTTTHQGALNYSGGELTAEIEDLLANYGSSFAAWGNILLQAGRFEQRPVFSINLAELMTTFGHSKVRYEIVMSDPRVRSMAGNVRIVTTHGNCEVGGQVIADTGMVSVHSAADLIFKAWSVTATNRDRKTTWTPVSVDTGVTKYTVSQTSLPTAIGGGGVFLEAQGQMRGEGLQIASGRSIRTKAPLIDMNAHRILKNISAEGWGIGVNFLGSNVIKALCSGGSAREVVEALLNEDPVAARIVALAKSRDGVDYVNHIIRASIAIWKKMVSTTRNQQGNKKREGLTFSVRLGATESENSWSELHPTRMYAEEDLILEGDKQSYRGVQMEAKRDFLVSGDLLEFRAEENTYDQSGSSGGFTIGLDNGVPFVGIDQAEFQSSGTRHLNTHAHAGRHVSTVAKKRLVLSGAQIAGNTIHAKAPETLIESLQDRHQSSSHSVSVATNGQVAFAASRASSAQASEVSGLFARSRGSLDSEHVTLIGGATQGLKVNAKRVDATDLHDFFKSSSFSVQLDIKAIADQMGGKKEGIMEFGAFDVRSQKQTGTTRATIAGGNGDQYGVNVDPNQMQSMSRPNKLHVAAPIIWINSKELAQEAREVKGLFAPPPKLTEPPKPRVVEYIPLAAPTKEKAPEKKVEKSPKLEKQLPEREANPPQQADEHVALIDKLPILKIEREIELAKMEIVDFAAWYSRELSGAWDTLILAGCDAIGDGNRWVEVKGEKLKASVLEKVDNARKDSPIVDAAAKRVEKWYGGHLKGQARVIQEEKEFKQSLNDAGKGIKQFVKDQLPDDVVQAYRTVKGHMSSGLATLDKKRAAVAESMKQTWKEHKDSHVQYNQEVLGIPAERTLRSYDNLGDAATLPFQAFAVSKLPKIGRGLYRVGQILKGPPKDVTPKPMLLEGPAPKPSHTTPPSTAKVIEYIPPSKVFPAPLSTQPLTSRVSQYPMLPAPAVPTFRNLYTGLPGVAGNMGVSLSRITETLAKYRQHYAGNPLITQLEQSMQQAIPLLENLPIPTQAIVREAISQSKPALGSNLHTVTNQSWNVTFSRDYLDLLREFERLSTNVAPARLQPALGLSNNTYFLVTPKNLERGDKSPHSKFNRPAKTSNPIVDKVIESIDRDLQSMPIAPVRDLIDSIKPLRSLPHLKELPPSAQEIFNRVKSLQSVPSNPSNYHDLHFYKKNNDSGKVVAKVRVGKGDHVIFKSSRYATDPLNEAYSTDFMNSLDLNIFRVPEIYYIGTSENSDLNFFTIKEYIPGKTYSEWITAISSATSDKKIKLLDDCRKGFKQLGRALAEFQSKAELSDHQMPESESLAIRNQQTQDYVKNIRSSVESLNRYIHEKSYRLKSLHLKPITLGNEFERALQEFLRQPERLTFGFRDISLEQFTYLPNPSAEVNAQVGAVDVEQVTQYMNQMKAPLILCFKELHAFLRFIETDGLQANLSWKIIEDLKAATVEGYNSEFEEPPFSENTAKVLHINSKVLSLYNELHSGSFDIAHIKSLHREISELLQAEVTTYPTSRDTESSVKLPHPKDLSLPRRRRESSTPDFLHLVSPRDRAYRDGRQISSAPLYLKYQEPSLMPFMDEMKEVLAKADKGQSALSAISSYYERYSMALPSLEDAPRIGQQVHAMVQQARRFPASEPSAYFYKNSDIQTVAKVTIDGRSYMYKSFLPETLASTIFTQQLLESPPFNTLQAPKIVAAAQFEDGFHDRSFIVTEFIPGHTINELFSFLGALQPKDPNFPIMQEMTVRACELLGMGFRELGLYTPATPVNPARQKEMAAKKVEELIRYIEISFDLIFANQENRILKSKEALRPLIERFRSAPPHLVIGLDDIGLEQFVFSPAQPERMVVIDSEYTLQSIDSTGAPGLLAEMEFYDLMERIDVEGAILGLSSPQIALMKRALAQGFISDTTRSPSRDFYEIYSRTIAIRSLVYELENSQDKEINRLTVAQHIQVLYKELRSLMTSQPNDREIEPSFLPIESLPAPYREIAHNLFNVRNADGRYFEPTGERCVAQVKDSSGQEWIVKGSTSKDEILSELSGLNSLNKYIQKFNLESMEMQVPGALGEANRIHFIVKSSVVGKTLEELASSFYKADGIKKQTIVQSLDTACQLIGENLGKLHKNLMLKSQTIPKSTGGLAWAEIPIGSLEDNLIEIDEAKFWLKSQGGSKIPPIKTDKLSTLKNAYRKNPGPYSGILGDVGPTNWILADNGKIAFIDTADIDFDQFHPVLKEYYSLLQSINYLGLNKEFTAKLSKSFDAGYYTHFPSEIIPKPAVEFLEVCNSIEAIANLIQKNYEREEGEVDINAIIAMVNEVNELIEGSSAIMRSFPDAQHIPPAPPPGEQIGPVRKVIDELESEQTRHEQLLRTSGSRSVSVPSIPMGERQHLGPEHFGIDPVAFSVEYKEGDSRKNKLEGWVELITKADGNTALSVYVHYIEFADGLIPSWKEALLNLLEVGHANGAQSIEFTARFANGKLERLMIALCGAPTSVFIGHPDGVDSREYSTFTIPVKVDESGMFDRNNSITTSPEILRTRYAENSIKVVNSHQYVISQSEIYDNDGPRFPSFTKDIEHNIPSLNDFPQRIQQIVKAAKDYKSGRSSALAPQIIHEGQAYTCEISSSSVNFVDYIDKIDGLITSTNDHLAYSSPIAIGKYLEAGTEYFFLIKPVVTPGKSLGQMFKEVGAPSSQNKDRALLFDHCRQACVQLGKVLRGLDTASSEYRQKKEARVDSAIVDSHLNMFETVLLKRMNRWIDVLNRQTNSPLPPFKMSEFSKITKPFKENPGAPSYGFGRTSLPTDIYWSEESPDQIFTDYPETICTTYDNYFRPYSWNMKELGNLDDQVERMAIENGFTSNEIAVLKNDVKQGMVSRGPLENELTVTPAETYFDIANKLNRLPDYVDGLDEPERTIALQIISEIQQLIRTEEKSTSKQGNDKKSFGVKEALLLAALAGSPSSTEAAYHIPPPTRYLPPPSRSLYSDQTAVKTPSMEEPKEKLRWAVGGGLTTLAVLGIAEMFRSKAPTPNSQPSSPTRDLPTPQRPIRKEITEGTRKADRPPAVIKEKKLYMFKPECGIMETLRKIETHDRRRLPAPPEWHEEFSPLPPLPQWREALPPQRKVASATNLGTGVYHPTPESLQHINIEFGADQFAEVSIASDKYGIMIAFFNHLNPIERLNDVIDRLVTEASKAHATKLFLQFDPDPAGHDLLDEAINNRFPYNSKQHFILHKLYRHLSFDWFGFTNRRLPIYEIPLSTLDDFASQVSAKVPPSISVAPIETRTVAAAAVTTPLAGLTIEPPIGMEIQQPLAQDSRGPVLPVRTQEKQREVAPAPTKRHKFPLDFEKVLGRFTGPTTEHNGPLNKELKLIHYGDGIKLSAWFYPYNGKLPSTCTTEAKSVATIISIPKGTEIAYLSGNIENGQPAVRLTEFDKIWIIERVKLKASQAPEKDDGDDTPGTSTGSSSRASESGDKTLLSKKGLTLAAAALLTSAVKAMAADIPTNVLAIDPQMTSISSEILPKSPIRIGDIPPPNVVRMQIYPGHVFPIEAGHPQLHNSTTMMFEMRKGSDVLWNHEQQTKSLIIWDIPLWVDTPDLIPKEVTQLEIVIDSPNGSRELVVLPEQIQRRLLKMMQHPGPQGRCCADLVNVLYNVSSELGVCPVGTMERKWEFTPNYAIDQFKPGDVVCFTQSKAHPFRTIKDSESEHYALVLSNRYFLSIYGNGGAWRVSTFEQIKEHYQSENVYKMTVVPEGMEREHEAQLLLQELRAASLTKKNPVYPYKPDGIFVNDITQGDSYRRLLEAEDDKSPLTKAEQSRRQRLDLRIQKADTHFAAIENFEGQYPALYQAFIDTYWEEHPKMIERYAPYIYKRTHASDTSDRSVQAISATELKGLINHHGRNLPRYFHRVSDKETLLNILKSGRISSRTQERGLPTGVYVSAEIEGFHSPEEYVLMLGSNIEFNDVAQCAAIPAKQGLHVEDYLFGFKHDIPLFNHLIGIAVPRDQVDIIKKQLKDITKIDILVIAHENLLDWQQIERKHFGQPVIPSIWPDQKQGQCSDLFVEAKMQALADRDLRNQKIYRPARITPPEDYISKELVNGIANAKNSYMNAAVQSLFAIPDFVEMLPQQLGKEQRHLTESLREFQGRKRILAALHHFADIWKNVQHTPKSLEDAIEALRVAILQERPQQEGFSNISDQWRGDAAEVLDVLLDVMGMSLEETTVHEYILKKDGYFVPVSPKTNSILKRILTLESPGKEPIQVLLNRSAELKREQFSPGREVKRNVPGVGIVPISQTSVKSSLTSASQDVLVIRMQKPRPLDVIQDGKIDASPLFEGNFQGAVASHHIEYELVGALQHRTEDGHWTSVVRTNEGWVYCNDSDVSQIASDDPRFQQPASVFVYKRVIGPAKPNAETEALMKELKADVLPSIREIDPKFLDGMRVPEERRALLKETALNVHQATIYKDQDIAEADRQIARIEKIGKHSLKLYQAFIDKYWHDPDMIRRYADRIYLSTTLGDCERDAQKVCEPKYHPLTDRQLLQLMDHQRFKIPTYFHATSDEKSLFEIIKSGKIRKEKGIRLREETFASLQPEKTFGKHVLMLDRGIEFEKISTIHPWRFQALQCQHAISNYWIGIQDDIDLDEHLVGIAVEDKIQPNGSHYIDEVRESVRKLAKREILVIDLKDLKEWQNVQAPCTEGIVIPLIWKDDQFAEVKFR